MITSITYRYINMDTESYTTEPGLLGYARAHPGGMHRATSWWGKEGELTTLVAYGRKEFDLTAIKRLDERLLNDEVKNDG